VDSDGPEQGPVAGSCESGDEPLCCGSAELTVCCVNVDIDIKGRRRIGRLNWRKKLQEMQRNYSTDLSTGSDHPSSHAGILCHNKDSHYVHNDSRENDLS
jgi:hypothetical protein